MAKLIETNLGLSTQWPLSNKISKHIGGILRFVAIVWQHYEIMWENDWLVFLSKQHLENVAKTVRQTVWKCRYLLYCNLIASKYFLKLSSKLSYKTLPLTRPTDFVSMLQTFPQTLKLVFSFLWKIEIQIPLEMLWKFRL